MKRVLIAEDEPVSRKILESLLKRAGREVIAVENGAQAWAVLQRPDAPALAVLDWMMPELDGLEVCRRLRERKEGHYVHVILVTARTGSEDVVAGLRAGADDFVTKPFHAGELQARLAVGDRLIQLNGSLQARVEELGNALTQVKQLQGLLPICMHCKKIRSSGDKWQKIESYISERTDASFSHSVCEPCLERYHPEPR